MHEKIFMIDYLYTFLGTANLTSESLNRHDNFILGIYSPEISSYIQQHFNNLLCNDKTASKIFYINHQKIYFHFLPDKNHEGLSLILKEIDQAKNNIDMAIYTLTHPLILEALERAHLRKVKLNIYVDFTSSSGPSKKACNYFREKNIPFSTSPKNKLLHYKIMLIDNKNLILGSSNWTKNAFKKNKDFFIVLYDINKKQLKQIKSIFNVIKKESN